ncbi:MAG: phosphoenolpyruvate--protein phosphotransferase [Bacillota bacterium]
MKLLKGIGVSPGIAIGKALIKEDIIIEEKQYSVQDIEQECMRLTEAKEKGKRQLQDLYEITLEKAGKHEAQIFASHTMILEDEAFIGEVESKIRSEKVNAEWALKEVSGHFIKVFEGMDNEYMQERVMDIRDVTQRMQYNLQGIEDNHLLMMNESAIIIAKDLTPSDTVQLDTEKVLGFITEVGGKTSHSAIMARSLEIPAIAGVDHICSKVQHGDWIVFDGSEGAMYINPDQATITKYQEKKAVLEERMRILSAMKESQAITVDGVHFEIAGNIGQPAEVDRVVEKGGDGIGLFRTEFIYMNRKDFPSEEEQFEAYKKVLQKMKEKPVVIRTFDIGGDKELDYLPFPEEMNPFLGYRAIRLCLDRVDLFKTQLRAILRASIYGNAKLMFPMISAVEELRQSKHILEEVKEGLRNEGIAFDENLQVGMMIETPSAVVAADMFAKEVDFFSIGTNDLIQYTMAVDRLNPHVSHLYSPFNPSVLRSIKRVIDEGHKAGIWVGMCGEAAAEPKLVPLLVGMGLDEFSMNPASILEVKWMIQQYAKEELQDIVNEVLELATIDEIEELLKGKMKSFA